MRINTVSKKEVTMVVTLPAVSLNGILPLTPAAVASTPVALLVLAVLLCVAVVLLARRGGGGPLGRRRVHLQSGRGGGAVALRTPRAQAAGPRRASRRRSRIAHWRPA